LLSFSYAMDPSVMVDVNATSFIIASDAPTQNLVAGWLAILGAWLAFGSFAVPMKWESVMDAGVHPLVYQCYKTSWCFVTSFLVLFFEPYEFSSWGIISGFSWVPAGVAAIIAVQNVGIACGQAVWQVTIILTSLVWGFAIMKDEHVKSPLYTCLSVLALCAGVVGMTLCFHLKKVPVEEVSTLHDTLTEQGTLHQSSADENAVIAIAGSKDMTAGGFESGLDEPQRGDVLQSTMSKRSRKSTMGEAAVVFASLGSAGGSYTVNRPRSRRSISEIKFGLDDVDDADADAEKGNASISAVRKASVPLGLGAAIFNGIWGGSNLVPSHYAPIHGVHFTISFATGALIANIVLVIGYVLLAKLVWRSPLPSPQFRVMALPGFLSGTMWSFGNFCSLYAVAAMGQGIGNSLIQSSVIVSGIWGICFYREMSGRPILYWSLWMMMCVGGVVGLALERN